MKNSTLCSYLITSNFQCTFFRKTDVGFLKFFTVLVTVILLSFPFVSKGQSLNNNKLFSSQQLPPDLENTVRNTLKQSSLKLQLIENDGQMGLPENVVTYFSSCDQTVFIEKDRLRVVIAKPVEEDKEAQNVNDKSSINARTKNYRYNVFNILFEGSRGFTDFQKVKRFQTRRNFISAGSQQHNVTNVASYGEIILKNVYPGIDLRLYSQETAQMEFDWIIAPNANASLIKMKFEGQNNLSINSKGDLEILLGMGKFNLRLPESYYVTPTGKQSASIRFRLSSNNEIQFKGLEKKQGKYPLVIDPDLLWGTFFDGGNANFDEYLYAVDFNNTNHLLYCAGAANRPVSNTYAAALNNSYDSSFTAMQDGFVYAITKDGQTIEYITYLGGTDNDVAVGLSVNSSYVYVSGHTASPDFPITKAANGQIEAFDTAYHGGNDGFVAIFNLALNTLIYSSYVGSPGDDKALTIRAMSDNSYYVSLSCADTLSQTATNYLVGAADNTFAGTADAWIGKFTSFNSLSFGTYIGGNGFDLVNDFQVLSNGDVVFVGNTFGITEINATVPNDAFGRDVLFGRISVPASGPVSFSLMEKIGGTGEDFGWGITTLGDSISLLVGQTNSSDFPLGGGPTTFQTVNRGAYDGFVARINNDGSGGFAASFVGGSDDDILVSVRPVVVKNLPVLLAFGTTRSNDLSAVNHTGGSFYSNANSGGYDMMWLICDFNLTFQYYLSYIGGSNNDYLGQTGAPIGSNHLFYNGSDSVVYLGTTTHSFESTQAPSFVGRGNTDTLNAGVPVFDDTKNNSNNDTHVILAISVRMLFYTLPVNWEKFQVSVLSDCSVQLAWQTANETILKDYLVQRSADGRSYATIATVQAFGTSFSYQDKSNPAENSKVSYRVVAEAADGQRTYSSVNLVQLCSKRLQQIRIYPTIVNNYFVVSGKYPDDAKQVLVQVVDASGRKIMVRQMPAVNGSQTLYFERRPVTGTYFVSIINQATSKILHTQKITVNN